LKEVIEKKKHYSGSTTFSPSDYIITKNVRIWLRDKIFNYCYFIPRGGQTWIDKQYDENPHLKSSDIEGMRTASNRAKDISDQVCMYMYLSIYLLVCSIDVSLNIYLSTIILLILGELCFKGCYHI
jgi:hypothetical protein